MKWKAKKTQNPFEWHEWFAIWPVQAWHYDMNGENGIRVWVWLEPVMRTWSTDQTGGTWREYKIINP